MSLHHSVQTGLETTRSKHWTRSGAKLSVSDFISTNFPAIRYKSCLFQAPYCSVFLAQTSLSQYPNSWNVQATVNKTSFHVLSSNSNTGPTEYKHRKYNCSHLNASSLNFGLICSTETSVNTYQPRPRNVPEEGRPRPRRNPEITQGLKSYFPQSTLRQVYSLFQIQYSTRCNLMLIPCISTRFLDIIQ
jgi:hypothetical protein